MTNLSSVVRTTLLADHNQASVSAMLNAILNTPLTPMEASNFRRENIGLRRKGMANLLVVGGPETE